MGWRAALSLLCAVASLACGSLPSTHYYTLPIPPPPQASNPKTNSVIGVELLQATDVLRDDRIVYYESPTQLNFYQYHRWSSDPATLLTEMMIRKLDLTGAFAGVRRLPSRAPVDYVLKGRLLNFEEIDYEGGVKGRVALELSLVRSRDNHVVWSDTRQSESSAEGKGVAEVVSALSRASGRLLDEALPLLVAEVERDLPGPSRASPK